MLCFIIEKPNENSFLQEIVFEGNFLYDEGTSLLKNSMFS